MKTAVSLPDPLFEDAEEAARKLGISRSELYARALSEYLEARRERSQEEALARVYRDQPSRLDPFFARLQAASLPEDEW